MSKLSSSGGLWFLTTLTTLTIVIAGLWPFEFKPENNVAWTKDGGGIVFRGRGMVYTPDPVKLHPAPPAETISLELLVRSDEEPRNMTTSLLSFYDHDPRQFMVGQWKSVLLIRIPPLSVFERKPYREVGVNGLLVKGKSHHITVTSCSEGTVIYADGKLQKHFPDFRIIHNKDMFAGRLIIGNSPEGSHAWHGSISGLMIYDRVLTATEVLRYYEDWREGLHPAMIRDRKPIAAYLFDEGTGQWVRDQSENRHHLLIPQAFQPIRRHILGTPGRIFLLSRHNLQDTAINILGFIPFGFLCCVCLIHVRALAASKAFVLAAFFGFALSLAIELIQVNLPARDSSLLDLISNTLGTLLGIVAFRHVRKFEHLRSP